LDLFIVVACGGVTKPLLDAVELSFGGGDGGSGALPAFFGGAAGGDADGGLDSYEWNQPSNDSTFGSSNDNSNLPDFFGGGGGGGALDGGLGGLGGLESAGLGSIVTPGECGNQESKLLLVLPVLLMSRSSPQTTNGLAKRTEVRCSSSSS
jgi:hypothetical protein